MVSESDAPHGCSASAWAATASGLPQGWLDGAVVCQGAQSAADWFDEANRAFAAWYAWWQAACAIAPAGAPLAGGLSAWWWSSQNALPFAGVV
ncbi:hypothetical protein BH160DRAFT_4776 [Burkholderia sp. H160]|nr:hypothetical protein BH160DRAFT_4776 [Burkholderia sp. H160]